MTVDAALDPVAAAAHAQEARRLVMAMATAARLTPYVDPDDPDHAPATWYDALFAPGADGDTFSRPDDPDRVLLAALAEEMAEVDRHQDGLGPRAHVAWLEQILRVPRLPVQPDRVVAHVTVDPKLAPAVVPPETLLRGGKDATGLERRYRTLDALTAHGASLVGLRSMAPGGNADGLPGMAGAAPEFPLDPQHAPDAPHTLRIHSPALAFEGGDLAATLAFAGATGVDGLAGVVWRWSRADGADSPTTTGTVSGTSVTVQLTGGCGAPAGETPWVECVAPASAPLPESLAFSSVTVSVSDRSDFVPQAAFYNDGALDVSKEFQPFGAVAKRGDAFYLRSDEAFAKAVSGLTITVTLLQEGGAVVSSSVGGSGIPGAISAYVHNQLQIVQLKLGSAYADISDDLSGVYTILDDHGDPSVRWQRRQDGGWVNFGSAASSFATVSATLGDEVASEPFAVAGQPGNYVRAFLKSGDFGWTAYQEDVAAFATGAVGGSKPTLPPPPVPPIASGITISYTTAPVAASRVESLSGWRRSVQPATGVFHPFRRAVSDTGAPGMVAVGLELPDTALGSSVSLWFDVDSAAPCGATDPVDASWQWWDGTTWQDLAVADSSRQLREAGLLRFVAPHTWQLGCSDTDAVTGRWVRLVTSAPDRLGRVLGVVVDAVVAEFVSAAADPSKDPSSDLALPPGTIKGTVSPMRGVKKVANLSSVRGRGPESDDGYRLRASALARHRNRSLTPWDYEQQVLLAFPEVAAIRCLPHTERDSGVRPGQVGLVVVPDRPLDPSPKPSVSLTERIIDVLSPSKPVGARLAVLCPCYEEVTVVASILLRRGVAALTGKETVAAALESVLHPNGVPGESTRWGRALYASSLISFLERQDSVDVVTLFELRDASGSPVEVVEVDASRGLYCSSGSHLLTCEEQL